MKSYLRFGNIPKDKMSKVHRSDAILRNEAGVSVWNCAFVNDVPFPLLPDKASEAAMADYFYMLLGNKPVYLVTGTELKERGSANEPLLGNDIKIVKEYTDDYEYLKSILRLHSVSECIDDISTAEPQREWIPISERLPYNHEYINTNGLFIVSDGYRSYSEYFDYGKQRFGEPTMSGFRVDYAVTAWMTLPQPYKVESEDRNESAISY